MVTANNDRARANTRFSPSSSRRIINFALNVSLIGPHVAKLTTTIQFSAISHISRSKDTPKYLAAKDSPTTEKANLANRRMNNMIVFRFNPYFGRDVLCFAKKTFILVNLTIKALKNRPVGINSITNCLNDYK